ncbi:RDD family protein [Rubritalea tangerina]|uniref:RDD family protein n=1 Tax=Rubritalea tangerina TaxID=430798 RepID=A0ABW4Z8J4_9BACT
MTPAPLSKRTISFIIDTIGFAAIIWIFGHIMLAVGDKKGDLTFNLTFFILLPITALTCWLVGNSPGKKIMGLSIVDEQTGESPSTSQYIKRCILFALLPSLNIIFAIPVLASKKRKAFHDMIAGTMVIEN